MLDWFRQLLEVESLSPHGICLLWRPELIWTHAISDAAIGTAYFSIPLALGYFVSKRKDVAFSWVFWCFAVFILACGTTHFFSIWTLWFPDYGAEALIKATTAFASVVTAVALWPLLPLALALPSPVQLREANDELRERVRERDEALERLAREHAARLQTEEILRQVHKMEAVGQLTGGVAHDFNNLLNVVVANLERIERRLPAGDDLHAPLQAALTGAERAAALTQKLLAFARKQPLSPTTVDVNRLVGETAELLGRTLGEGIALETSLDPNVCQTRIDPHEMENAIVNLAVNARDAMSEGGTLTVATRDLPAAQAVQVPELSPQRHVVIEVCDTGLGMPKDVADHAFEPFFTTKPLGQGTGLGLSQVFGFVKQSGGHVVLESREGAGTTVRLYLPCAGQELASESDLRYADETTMAGEGI